jgi:hypothetical protein
MPKSQLTKSVKLCDAAAVVAPELAAQGIQETGRLMISITHWT